MLRSRLAPTPSGYLHLRQRFFLRADVASCPQTARTLRLRIDDLDGECQARILTIFSPRWVALGWIMIPALAHVKTCLCKLVARNIVCRRINAALMRLAEQGDVFACDCSRSLLAQTSPNGLYPGTCRSKKPSSQTLMLLASAYR